MKPLAMSTAKTSLRGHRSLGLDYAAVRHRGFAGLPF